MTSSPIGRRAAILSVAGMAPLLARAQVLAPPPAGPGPAAPLPTVPPNATPAPVASPVRPVVPAPIYDKSKAYYVFFDQTIDVASMRALRLLLANLVEAGVSDITLVVESPGGLVDQVLITYSFIRALPARIRTHAQGFVASSATLLYLAGEERSADRTAHFIFHPAQSSIAGVIGDAQIRERLGAFDALAEMDAQIYRDRTGLPEAEYARFLREAVTYNAEQARGFGIVQTVADLRVPGEGRAKILFLT